MGIEPTSSGLESDALAVKLEGQYRYKTLAQ